MSEPEGRVAAFERVLGLPQGDDRILDAVDLVVAPFEVDTFPPDEEYWSFNGEGVEFLFAQDRLKAIMFHLRPDPDDPELGEWDTPLIDGLPLSCSAEQAMGVLGSPEKSGTGDHGPWHRFSLAKGLLHLDFDASGCRLITLMDEPRE